MEHHYIDVPFSINILAGVEGFEPSQAVLETDVLPLTLYSYKNYFLIITQKKEIDKTFYKFFRIKLEEFQYINVYILSKEDVAVSKIIGLADKDIEDLEQIIPKCNKNTLNKIIEEILNRDDLFESKKEGFKRNLKIFREKYNV